MLGAYNVAVVVSLVAIEVDHSHARDNAAELLLYRSVHTHWRALFVAQHAARASRVAALAFVFVIHGISFNLFVDNLLVEVHGGGLAQAAWRACKGAILRMCIIGGGVRLGI